MYISSEQNVREAYKKHNNSPDSLIDFSASINPLGPSPMAMDVLRRGVSLIRHYPDPDAQGLKIILSRYLNTPAENILLGNGETEIIYNLCRVLSPQRLLLPVPMVDHHLEALFDVPIEYLPLECGDQFQFPVESLKNKARTGDLIFICNPNNPTGMLIPRPDLFEMACAAKKVGAVIVVDEAYMDFVEENETVLPESVEHTNLIVVGSLTNFFAMPGLRLGFMAAAKTIIDQVSKLLLPWRINIMAQLAGKASLEDTSYIMTTLNLVKREREFLINGLQQIRGLKVYPSSANFVYVDCRNTGKTAGEISEQLEMRGILIRVAGALEESNNYYFRLAIRQRNDNLILLKMLKEVIYNY